MEPEGRDEEDVARLQDTLVASGTREAREEGEIRAVDVQDSGLVASEVEIVGIPRVEEDHSFAASHLHQQVVHHLSQRS